MRRFALLLVVISGCASNSDDGDYPVVPGGANGPSGGGGGGTQLAGRACLVDDPRDLGACSTGDASGLTVTAGGMTTTTDADGNFELPITADGTMVRITGDDIVPTQAAADAAGAVPLLRADLYAQMMAANGVTPSTGSGSILARVTRAGEPVSGVTATSNPAGSFDPMFDGTTPTSWTVDGTGARGIVWVPGVAAGPTSLTFSDIATSGETTVGGVQVINGGITILDSVLP